MTPNRSFSSRLLPIAAAAAALAAIAPVHASSHREAPAITGSPKVDATDFYMFNSYEPGRAGYVTLIADYLPLQDAYGGPNYFKLDPNALYEIEIDNNGDAKEDITFQFRFTNTSKGQTLPINGTNVAIPLTQFGQVTDFAGTNLNVTESYTLTVGARRPAHRYRGARRGRRGRRRQREQRLLEAFRQHRHEDDSGLSVLRRQVRLHDQHSRLRHARQGSSSASARTRSRSTSA